MDVIYTAEPFPETFTATLFLAGPTTPDQSSTPWRAACLARLADVGFTGTVFVPETRPGTQPIATDRRVRWETDALTFADAIACWVPRDLTTAPAFTTNVEFGLWAHSGKLVFGAPPDAPGNEFLQATALRLRVPATATLDDLVAATLEVCGEPAVRTGGQRHVPLALWRTGSFQSWYRSIVDAGHVLVSGKVLWSAPNEAGRSPFLWSFQPTLEVAGEDRVKGNEFVTGRPDVASVVAYGRSSVDDVLRVVVVREFRSTCRTGHLVELPSGSASTGDMAAAARDELAEETGLVLDAARFVPHKARQLAATVLTHRAHTFVVELSSAELDAVEADTALHGLVDDGEVITVEVRSIAELREDPAVDWTTLGIVYDVLSTCT